MGVVLMEGCIWYEQVGAYVGSGMIMTVDGQMGGVAGGPSLGSGPETEWRASGWMPTFTSRMRALSQVSSTS